MLVRLRKRRISIVLSIIFLSCFIILIGSGCGIEDKNSENQKEATSNYGKDSSNMGEESIKNKEEEPDKKLAKRELKKYEDLRGEFLWDSDLRENEGIFHTLTFDDYTMWPDEEFLPNDFNIKGKMEWGKNPGLGVKKLHRMGYTGKGVNIAYIDQPVQSNHRELEEIDFKYYEDVMKKYNENVKNSMHGSVVLSMLSGKNVGVAPEASVYYAAYPCWKRDYKTHADSIRLILEKNEDLPDDKKIKIIGISDMVNDDIKVNPEELKLAVEEAKVQGITVIFCNEPLRIHRIVADPMSDRDDYRNYKSIIGDKLVEEPDIDGLYVPSDGTAAINDMGSDNSYAHFSVGGYSWTTPYVLGVMALGLEVAPELTGDELIDYLMRSAFPIGTVKQGGIINPEGFISLIEKEKGLSRSLVLYNSDRLNDGDREAIDTYVGELAKSNNVFQIDVKGKKDAQDVYDFIREKNKEFGGRLSSIQIFGSSKDVPSFKMNYKIKVTGGIVEGGEIFTDLFYSNFNNEGKNLRNLSLYEIFQKNLDVDFNLDWKVVRLPLKSGEYKAYIDKYFDYNREVKNQGNIPLVNFSSPILRYEFAEDDMAQFIKERMDKAYGIMGKEDYRLYGNQKGNYPVGTEVLGDVSKENLKMENHKEIIDLLINGHGQPQNIDKTIFVYSDEVYKYEDIARRIEKPSGNSVEVRVSLLNNETINEVLDQNYYNLILHNCLTGYDLNDTNLTHEAMANGEAVNVFSASYTISGNGAYGTRKLEKLKENNIFYFYYNYFKNYYGGYNRSDSFFMAKREYVREILNHTDFLGGQNYQFNLMNALVYHHFGLIEIN